MARKRAAGASPAADPRFAQELPPEGATGHLVPSGKTGHSSASQAYLYELKRIQRIQGQIAAMDVACQDYLNGATQWLEPLRAQCRQTQRDLALQLAEWLRAAEGDLSRTQRAKARHHLCQLAQPLAERGDADMAVLHDAHSPQTLADKRRAAAEALRSRLADWLAPDNLQAHAATDPDELLQAARAQWQAATEAQQVQRMARQAKRAARKAQREPQAELSVQAHAEQEAGNTLRDIYRRLASALHPDRAPSDDERARMHTLMSAVNAAYARQDLLSLLELQGHAEQVDAQHLERSSAQRLQALTWLLKQQAASLERERQQAQQRWLHTLGLAAGASLAAPELQQWLEEQRTALAQSLQRLQSDLSRTQDLPGLKAWLNSLASPHSGGQSMPGNGASWR